MKAWPLDLVGVRDVREDLLVVVVVVVVGEDREAVLDLNQLLFTTVLCLAAFRSPVFNLKFHSKTVLPVITLTAVDGKWKLILQKWKRCFRKISRKSVKFVTFVTQFTVGFVTQILWLSTGSCEVLINKK